MPGAYADLVLFDPATVIDRATTSDPHALATGIERVWVNGQPVFASGAATELKPGRVLRRKEGPKMTPSSTDQEDVVQPEPTGLRTVV